jgi:putative copper resistance protein D
MLLKKALTTAALLGLALFNRLRIKDCEQRLSALRKSVIAEWLLGIGAVAAVSLLGTLPPMISS